MARLNLRIPDTTMVALRHELAREREYRGRKYSMNDLCALKLAANGAQVRHTTDTGTLTIPRVPPPPPVPIDPRWQRAWTPPGPREEPQPERMVQAAIPALEVVDAPEIIVVGDVDADIPETDGSGDGPAGEPAAISQFEDEGGSDGHLDH
jgi:hypothetical protein